MKKTIKWIVALLLLAAIGFGVAHFLKGGSRAPAKRVFHYDTAAVQRGDVASTIAASGTIEPEELVDVGSQVSGKIVAFGTDAKGAEVDYCSAVTNGMVLARIDDVTYLADLDVARAQQSRALANVESAKASEQKAKVDLDHARKDWERAQRIGVGLALSQSDYDSYQASYESAEAALAVATASIGQAEAAVVEAKASVEKAERNLGYCTISAPVDGIVIDRRVNLGQTVVSSMSVSSLFLVAKDLAHMRIWAAVNEADVGQIHEGQGVAFTVDAFPGRTFRGTVRRVRLNATITSNVVTYVVEIDCDNPDGTLLPYLTANVEFETATAKGALVVPARALRWAPADAPAAPPMPKEMQGAKGAEGTGEIAVPDGVVWVLEDEERPPRPVPVKVLLNNGSDAAIEALEPGALAEGAQVVTRSTEMVNGGKPSAMSMPGAAPGGSDSGTSNPFLPKMPKPRKNRGGPPPG